jgi:hypothetical protein
VIVTHPRQLSRAEAADTTSTKASDVGSAKTAHVTSAEAAHVAATAATTVSSAAPAAGLCTGRSKAAGKQRSCQNHHHSSSHHILHSDRRSFRHRALFDAGMC